jgi:hypothetical protein
MQRVALGMSLDTTEKRDAYKGYLVEKWGAAGWLNQEHAKSDQAKRFHEKLSKVNCPELKGDYQIGEMALILDNQRFFQKDQEQYAVAEIRGERVKIYLEQAGGETTTGSEALPTREVMPIVRRLYAIVLQNDISRVQTMSGPSSYVFWLDYLRANAYQNGTLTTLTPPTNFLSLEYNDLLTPELGVPAKVNLKLVRQIINAVKLMVGATWTTEAEEDAKALLNFSVESEMMAATGEEVVRDLFGRHLGTIFNAAQGNWNPSVGSDLPGVWQGALTPIQMPNLSQIGSGTLVDYKQAIFASLVDGATQFNRANRRMPGKIIAGYSMAGFLQKLNTATAVGNPDPGDMSSVGITDYGSYAARWQIVGTEFLPDNVAIMYVPNPDPLRAGHVYAPYVPVQAGPKVYADYDPSTGNFQNVDAWTRTLRERSAEVVTKPYAFQLIYGPTAGFGQWT